MVSTISGRLFLTLILACPLGGYAVETYPPKDGGSDVPAQNTAMEEWKEMRQESDLTMDAGKKSALSELFETPKKKVERAVSERVRKVTADRTKGIAGSKIGDAVGEDAGKPSKMKKPKRAKSLGKMDGQDAANKAKSPDEAAKAKSPDGTTRTESPLPK